ncbi:MAG: helix-turn-helix domain-containing protein [Candidatus Tectimicrobiota bacterium]
MPVDSDSLGAYLRQERERRQISLQAIAAATKIQLKFLEALENDAYDQLPAVPFVVGFLRAYAQHIALDPDTILTAYRSLQQTPETSDEGRPSVDVPAPAAAPFPRARVLTLLLVLVLGAGLGVYEWRRGRQAQSPVTAFPAPPEHLVKPAAPSLPQSTQSAPPEPAVASVPPAAASAPAAPEPPSVTPAAETARSASGATAPPPAQPAGGSAAEQTSMLVLQAQALADTWLRIEIDGQKQQSLLLNSGKSLQWEAHERFRLTIGNARGTRLALNGQAIALPAGRSNVIRDLLLTRANLP